MTPRQAPTRCPACNEPPRPTLRLSNGAWLLQCPSCRLAWWPWPEFDAADFYDRDYFQSECVPRGYADYDALEPGLRRTARRRLTRILRCMRRTLAVDRTPRLLDLGCGTGVFLDEARRAGWDPSGIEVSDYAAQRAAQRGVTVERRTLETLELPRAEFDCVTLWDVIEHVRTPRDVLEAAAAALRPGGVLALSTGDVTSACAHLCGARWHLFNLPEHLYFFSPRSLHRLVSSSGCRVRSIVNEVTWVPVSYLLERLWKSVLRRSPPASSQVWRGLVPATLGDVLGVYAVREDWTESATEYRSRIAGGVP